MTYILCSICENPVGNYNRTYLGILCDDCFKEELTKQDFLDSQIDYEKEFNYHSHGGPRA